MEKQRQLLVATGENYESAAEKVSQFIVDPTERAKVMEELKAVSIRHARLQRRFDGQCKALEFVSQKLKDVPDMDIEQYMSATLAELSAEDGSDEQIWSESSSCQRLDSVINARTKIKSEES